MDKNKIRFKITNKEYESIQDFDDFMIKVFQYNCGFPYKSLNQSQKVLYSYMVIVGDVGNGGFIQFFQNNQGENNKDGLKAFKLIGDNETYEIFVKAIKIYKKNPKYFNYPHKAELNSVDEEELGKLEEEFYDYTKQREQKIEDYFKKHLNDFLLFDE